MPTPEKMTSISLSPTNMGIDNRLGTWTDNTVPFLWAGLRNLGLVFDFSVSVDSDGRALAPVRPFTRKADTISGDSALPFTLTIDTNATSPEFLGTSDLYVRIEPDAPDLWSASNLPNSLSSVSSGKGKAVTITTAVTTTAEGDGTYNIVQELDFFAAYNRIVTGQSESDILSRIAAKPTWNGRIAMWLTSTGGNPTVSSVTLEGQTVPFHTGASNFPPNRRARVVHDYRTGQPYLSDEAVEDGWTEGLMVHRDNWDPEDETPTFVSPSEEGVVDDTVPSVE